MDLTIDSGGPIIIHAPGTAWDGRRFAALTMADLGELQAYVAASGGDASGGRFVTVFELHRYAQTPDGADRVLLLSMRREDPAATIEQVRGLGSLLRRVEVARAVMGHSLTTGEDELMRDDDGQKKRTGRSGPETGSTRPS